jgi:hypothetical protein
VYFDLYLNLTKGVKPAPTEPYYIGSLTLFGVAHHDGSHGAAATPLYVRFVFPQALLKLIAGKKLDVSKLELTIVPQTGRKPVGSAVSKRGGKRNPVNIARIQILQMR